MLQGSDLIMNIKEILSQPEGRRLEFKAEWPVHSDLAKTVVAFANDAGGDLYNPSWFYQSPCR